MRHVNIPVFIPHLGCPNQCVFCNQRSISEHQSFSEEGVRAGIEQVLSTLVPEDEAEIAFFGGSFTGIDRGLMCRLLDLVQTYVKEGRVASIRLSTRPDYINAEILSILSRYSVKTIELGLQSMDDAVLLDCRRGHTAREAEVACRAVVAAGFSLVGQMMIGLPGATSESEMQTAQKICDLGASAVRIYPTVVFYDTPLCEMTQHGLYAPLSVKEAVERTAPVLQLFRARAPVHTRRTVRHRVPDLTRGGPGRTKPSRPWRDDPWGMSLPKTQRKGPAIGTGRAKDHFGGPPAGALRHRRSTPMQH